MGDLSSISSVLLTRQTQSLLENLFQVLDKSERAMLKGLMSNRGTAEALLEQFKSMPKDNGLLKNFRHMLYENDDLEKRRQQERMQQAQLQQFQTYQNTGRNGR